MMPNGAVIRRTFTLTTVEADLLEKIARHRHPTDRRIESLTVRELIREEYKRISERAGGSAQKQQRRRANGSTVAQADPGQ